MVRDSSESSSGMMRGGGSISTQMQDPKLIIEGKKKAIEGEF
jgi:hypothetical protein